MSGLARNCLRRVAMGLGALAVLGVAVAWSGVVDVGASSGHWRITSWALHWVMQNSTRTYALLEPDPPADLDEPARVRRAAGHFETSCAPCHGSPLHPPPVLGAHMTPPPPGLVNSAAKWDAPELARIVRHGIKYTAMPAWIAVDRDDEVWSMVAFLRALPRMSGADYRKLAFGPVLPDDRVLEGCARCHGMDGGSDGGVFPVIGGQSEAYLAATLRAFKEGRRHSGFMQLASDGIAEDDLIRMSRHYAAQQGLSEIAAAGESEGATIALHGLPEADVPACESCHGASARRNPAYPRLAGQDAGYLAAQLRLMKAEKRGGTAYSPIMERIAQRLPDTAIEAVAHYYKMRR